MNKFSLIITAGGTSSRYGSANKLLEKLCKKTVIEVTVSKFLDYDEINEIIIPTNIEIIDNLKKIFLSNKIHIIQGGKSRQESVYNALQHVNNEYVIIHDGARPLIDKAVISEVIKQLPLLKAISVMVKTTDTIKEVDESGKIICTIDRTKLYNTQTPQAFETSLIKKAHERLKAQTYTDDSSMLEYLGYTVHMIEGNYKNIKITTKNDLDFAEIIVNQHD